MRQGGAIMIGLESALDKELLSVLAECKKLLAITTRPLSVVHVLYACGGAFVANSKQAKQQKNRQLPGHLGLRRLQRSAGYVPSPSLYIRIGSGQSDPALWALTEVISTETQEQSYKLCMHM